MTVVVGIVCDRLVAREGLLAAVAAAGAAAEVCTEASAIASSASVDLLVLDIAAAPERLSPVAVALATDPRTRLLPRIVIVSGETPVEEVSAFGPAIIIPLARAASALSSAITDLVQQVRARHESEARARADNTGLRLATESLVLLQKEGATLSHDTRVLFGVIMGYAANLRDGIAGPVTDVQRVQVGNIVEAASDAAALLDRYVTTLRKTERLSQPPDSTRGAARRAQHDVAELVRGMVALFEGVAAAKQIRLTAIAPHAIPSWCDAIQIKQVLTNLLMNALKFTPSGGAVQLEVRAGAPASSRSGAAARRTVELVVTDTGPGIPASERSRVFERGERLERDLLTPGGGIGLAVVRDVMDVHGGSVRVEDAIGGGASFVLTLPADLRSRAEDGSLRGESR